MRIHTDGFRIARRIENLDLQFILAGRQRLMKINAPVDRAYQHGLRADRGKVKGELALRVGLAVEDGLHSSLQLEEDYFDIGDGFSGRAILHRAVDGRAINKGERQEQADPKSQRRNPSRSHCAPRPEAAGLTPRGRRTWDSVI